MPTRSSSPDSTPFLLLGLLLPFVFLIVLAFRLQSPSSEAKPSHPKRPPPARTLLGRAHTHRHRQTNTHTEKRREEKRLQNTQVGSQPSNHGTQEGCADPEQWKSLKRTLTRVRNEWIPQAKPVSNLVERIPPPSIRS